MPRRPRCDKPGRLHHLLNRGQDRQEIFSRPADYRFFLALLACAVRAGRIRLHAFCLMPNHFHLLVESVDGDISATMQWIQGRFAGYFNCTHEHVGHVFGGRFHSYPVLSVVYLFALIRYIDRNPIKTRKPKDPLQLYWCSAFYHARPGCRPRWLARDVVDRFLETRLARGEDRVSAYRTVFRIGVRDPAGDDLVESRIAGHLVETDDLDSLIHMQPEALGEWLRQRVKRDTPISKPFPLVDSASVLKAVERIREEEGEVRMRWRGSRLRDVMPLVQAGLLRDLAGRTLESAGSLIGVSTSCVRTRIAAHHAALVVEEPYLQLAARSAHRALAIAFGADVRDASRAVDRV